MREDAVDKVRVDQVGLNRMKYQDKCVFFIVSS